jgi:phthalate 4,5-dioxygenase oxygenase subunit
MLSHADNLLLTRIGPGAPMGALFRRYWLPALLCEELPDSDGPPVRVKLLGERLIAFRDTSGNVGIIDEFCAHRGVSLWFGRNEESGIRCPYHGWKYDVNGQCTEVPSEPAESGFCARIKLTAYPTAERGGVIWIHMGPRDSTPPVPEFEWATVPDNQRYVCKRFQESNWLQAMEGGIDSAHVSFLHSGELHTDPLHKNTHGAKFQHDTRPRFEVVQSDGGLLIGARRNAEAGSYYWRISQWIMPTHTMIPPYGANPLNGHCWVPIDDESCWVWNMTHHPTRPLSEAEMHSMMHGEGMYAELIPGTYRPVANRDNDYLIDRAAQRAGRHYSGVKGIAMQDASLQESMGPLQDRAKENLVSTDNAIIMARSRLMKSARALEKGTAPPGLDPACHRVRSASIILPESVPFREGAKDVLVARAGAEHTRSFSA